jgi:hypothetical protein
MDNAPVLVIAIEHRTTGTQDSIAGEGPEEALPNNFPLGVQRFLAGREVTTPCKYDVKERESP